MPIEFHIHRSRHLLLVKGTGTATCDDILRHLETVSAHPDYLSPMKKLVDYRELEGLRISPEEARLIAAKKHALNHVFARERCAFVAPRDAVFGSSRVHEALIDGAGVDTAVFRTIEAALDWLGVSDT